MIFYIVLAIVFFTKGHVLFPVLILVSAILLLYGYEKSGTVYLAFQHLKRQNINRAEVLLLQTKRPEKLSKGQKAYYHFTKGIICAEKQQWNTAFSELNEALALGLRTKNDTSIVLFSLASIEFSRKNYDEAKILIQKCKEFELKPEIELGMKELEEKINSTH
ncbi:hypothetical protein [Kordia jejudonensis]|uniref:hypothetical protein n=1 Tax=Kordia jejudonensis TaxID=1348245 RepID=UPI0012E08F4C|nr:hypothetical protein [Kordia jejudonensis]